MRKIGGVLAGIIVAMLIVSLMEWAGNHFYPVSGEIASADRAAILAWMQTVPLPAKIIVASGWAIASVAGPWLALRIVDWRAGGWIVTGLFLLSSIANQMMLPHPVWMLLAALALPPVGGALAQWLHRKPYPGEPLLG